MQYTEALQVADRLPDKDTVFHGLLLLAQRPMPLVLKSNGTRLAPGVELGRQEGGVCSGGVPL